jgi:ferritin-like metal-binding protein YciE
MNDTGAASDTIRYDSEPAIDDTANAKREQHSLQTYVSDLLALERHIEQPLGAQRESDAVALHPTAKAAIEKIASQNRAHITALEMALERLGGHPAAPVKAAWMTILGGAASAIGGARKTKVTKWLRDDDTALNLAAFSYTLLHATAIGLGDQSVAALARAGLADYARSVMEINQVVPAVVLRELTDEGNVVVSGAAETIREQMNAIWREEADVTKRAL